MLWCPNTCLAGMRNVTSHSERNSIILASRLGRMVWAVLNAGSRSGTCAAVGIPTVRLAYSSETHWLGFSMSIVILARGQDRAVWTDNAIVQMSTWVLLLGAPLPSGDIAWQLLRCLYCVVYGPWHFHVLPV